MSPSPSRRRPPPQASAALIDAAAIRADLAATAKKHDADEAALRVALAARLKTALTEGRDRAEERLRAGGSGRECAEGLSALERIDAEMGHMLTAPHFMHSDEFRCWLLADPDSGIKSVVRRVIRRWTEASTAEMPDRLVGWSSLMTLNWPDRVPGPTSSVAPRTAVVSDFSPSSLLRVL